MKNRHSDMSQRYLILTKIDSDNLFRRIKERQKVYMENFSAKRDRDIFDEIFTNRYKDSKMFDLAHLPTEVIELANDFYTQVDELYWYLMHTEDMPNTIEDEVIRNTALIKRKYEVLTLYIDAELSGDIALEEDDRPSETQDSHDVFITEDELEAIEDQS